MKNSFSEFNDWLLGNKPSAKTKIVWWAMFLTAFAAFAAAAFGYFALLESQIVLTTFEHSNAHGYYPADTFLATFTPLIPIAFFADPNYAPLFKTLGFASILLAFLAGRVSVFLLMRHDIHRSLYVWLTSANRKNAKLGFKNFYLRRFFKTVYRQRLAATGRAEGFAAAVDSYFAGFVPLKIRLNDALRKLEPSDALAGFLDYAHDQSNWKRPASQKIVVGFVWTMRLFFEAFPAIVYFAIGSGTMIGMTVGELAWKTAVSHLLLVFLSVTYSLGIAAWLRPFEYFCALLAKIDPGLDKVYRTSRLFGANPRKRATAATFFWSMSYVKITFYLIFRQYRRAAKLPQNFPKQALLAEYFDLTHKAQKTSENVVYF